MTYRELTETEIAQLKANGCYSTDWSLLSVAESFDVAKIRNVHFEGEVQIGENCRIENVGIIQTTESATFGEGTVLSVMNEAGNGNIMMYSGLSAQLAAVMMQYEGDKDFTSLIRKMISEEISLSRPRCTTIGDNVTVTGCRELTNVNIGNDCEISGASRLVECTLRSHKSANVFVGDDVICDNVIMQPGASVTDAARLYDTFVGEACHVGRGFTSENSVFFANSYMDNGESCAAFCGPFSVSHHKSSLLIGGQYSFYNAGSGTNFSNHAYKIGPIHYGTMHRGAKTASGAHILWPAQIGLFSMAMGKIQSHPDTRNLPFSYIISQGETTLVVPGRNLTTVGTFRDTAKWPKRDMRATEGRISHVNFDWLSPLTISECIKGKELLNEIQEVQGKNTQLYAIDGGAIRNHALTKGIKLYDLAIKMFIYDSLKDAQALLPTTTSGTGDWLDLAGMLAPATEIDALYNDIMSGNITDIQTLEDRLADIHDQYESYRWAFAYNLITKHYGIDTLEDSDINAIRQECASAREEWLLSIRRDAEKEYNMGDVSLDTLNDFLKAITV